jgi:hypothetical protein
MRDFFARLPDAAKTVPFEILGKGSLFILPQIVTSPTGLLRRPARIAPLYKTLLKPGGPVVGSCVLIHRHPAKAEKPNHHHSRNKRELT